MTKYYETYRLKPESLFLLKKCVLLSVVLFILSVVLFILCVVLFILSVVLFLVRGTAIEGAEPPKHLACQQIYSTPLVLVDIGSRGTPGGSLLCWQIGAGTP